MSKVDEDASPPAPPNELEPIAIIGMACRLPAGATNVENLWTALASGQSGWSPHPSERYMPERYYHPNADKKGSFYAKGAHYLEEDIARFDAPFFNITESEATTLDPQHRNMLEISYEALENAGIPLSSIAGKSVGVFVGGSSSDYQTYMHHDLDNLLMFETTGNHESLLANRVSYAYDLRGPSLTLETACSSSLAALHVAFQSLQSGESSVAIVGGSVIRLSPAVAISLSNMKLLSPDGKSYAFDDRATSGFGRGEGAGCIILKRLDAAMRDGDAIRAIIRNSGTNQDGKTAGITMPNGKSQASLIRTVYGSAGLDPLETDYIEAHGTGTATGDPIEAAALGEVFGRSAEQRPVVIGSIKSNIGHLEAASGIASVIKAALMLERRFITPNCDLQIPNRKIPFQKYNLKVSHKYKPWDSRGVRRASVNNFSFGGTNVHVVMEEAIPKNDIRSLQRDITIDVLNDHNPEEDTLFSTTRPYVFLFSAHDRESLQRHISLFAQYVIERPLFMYRGLLSSLAFTLGQRRTVLPWRLAISATDQDDFVQKLKDVALTPTRSVEQPKVGFVFTGQGSQWAQMGIDLSRIYPVYALTIQKADCILAGLGATWSLVTEIEKPDGGSLIDRPHISQPACTALQIALVDLLHSWGISAQCVTGHSSGEIAAAYAAGILGIESCMAIAYYRGVVATTLMENSKGNRGAMLAIGTSQEHTQSLIDASADVDGHITIACINSPNSMTVSGDADRISRLSELADVQSVWNRRLKVDVAYHSHHMDKVAHKYASLLGKLKPNLNTTAEFYSSLKGRKVSAGSLDTAYWIENLTSAVKFSQAFTSLCEPRADAKKGVDLVIEIGPHSTLQGPIRQITQSFQGSPRQIRSFASIVRNKDNIATILDLSATLLASGCAMKMENVNFPSPQSPPNVLTDLPTYQWNHTKRYWHEPREIQETLKYMSPKHDLLGNRVMDCSIEEPQWKNLLGVDDVPWLRDHVVQGVIIFPMAGYCCMAIEACRQQARWKGVNFDRFTLRDIRVQQPLTLPESAPVELRLTLKPLSEGPDSVSEVWRHFKVSSWTSEKGWLDHCRGLVAATQPDAVNLVALKTKRHAGLHHQMGNSTHFMDLCTDSRDPALLYEYCEHVGFHFGPTFRRLENVRMGPSQRATFTMTVPDTLSCMPCNHESEYTFHPIGLDAILQAATPFVADNCNYIGAHMPVSIQEIVLSTEIVHDPGSVFRINATSSPCDAFSRKRVFDVVALDLNRASHPCAIVLKGLVEALVQNSDDVLDISTSRCLRTQWEPCMSYLNQTQLKSIFPLDPPKPRGADELQALNTLSLYYIKQALRQTKSQNIASKHLQRLYGWMQNKVGVIPNGNLPNDHSTNGYLTGDDLYNDDITTLYDSSKPEEPAVSMMHRVGRRLPAILQGNVDPFMLMSEDDLLSRFYTEDENYQRLCSHAASYVRQLSFQTPVLRILEIGAYTTVATVHILAGLSGASCKSVAYHFADALSEMSETTKARLASWKDIVQHKTLDLEKSLVSQKFNPGTYDLIVASNLDHATSLRRKELTTLRSLLKTEGKLILFNEPHDREQLALLPFATLPGWWAEEEADHSNGRNGSVTSVELNEVTALNEQQRSAHFEESGFSELDAASVMFINASAPPTSSSTTSSDVVIVTQWLPHGTSASQIKATIRNQGATAVEWIDFTRLREVVPDGKHFIIIDDPKNHYLTKLTVDSFEGLKGLSQAAGILWVTGGLLSPDAGLVRGLARTLRAEFGREIFVTLGIEDWEMPSNDLVDLIAKVFERSFYGSSLGTEYEREFVVKDGIVHIPRLVPDTSMDRDLSIETQEGSKELQPFSQDGRPLRMTITSPGFLDTLSFIDDERVALQIGYDEIEIDIKASGLNFKDIILALGQLPGYYLGQECSGIVTKAGLNVSGLKVGDRVCAIVPGAIANLGRCKADCAVRLLDSIPFPVGASIPLIYCTSQYCLAHVAKLQPGETILIHAAAGGVGQSAVMLAQALQAKIYATVGSQEKKAFLMQTYNIPENQIFYSRDTSFAQGVLDATNGKGVDVVLNSLAGEQLRATWKCMAPFGRFVEIGKRDITTNVNLEMAPFERTVTFAAVDLGDLIEHRPTTLQQVFAEVMELMRLGTVKPVSPVHEFVVSEVETAFRSLQSGKLTGKVVITPNPDDMVMAPRPSFEPAILRENVSYLITGGTGGIGRAICVWMVQHGAKNIILSSRSGKKQVDTMKMVQELTALGIKVEVYKSDVAIEADLQRLISDCEKTMPPIGGVIHGAYVNKDVAFELANYQDWIDVVQPKYQGAWNLHNTLRSHKLDFFIMLSSISGVIGNRGQAAYAAANSFLDSFAHYRASLNLPATSIDLGVVKEIGHVAERPELQEKLELLSENALSKADVLALIKLAIAGKIDRYANHQCTVGLSFENYNPQNPAFYWATDARFCHLRRGIEEKETATNLSTKQALKKTSTVEEAAQIASNALVGKFSSVLIIPAEEVSVDKPVVALGLDSLVAVEVRSWIAKEMDAKMSTMELMTSSSIKAVAEMVVGRSVLLEGLRGKTAER